MQGEGGLSVTNNKLGLLCGLLVVTGLIFRATSLFTGLGATLYILGYGLVLLALLALIVWFDDQE